MLRKGRLGRALVLATLAAVVLAQPAGAVPGDLDSTFAGDGRLAVPALGPFVARAVAIDAKDRIVVAGYLCEASADATCLEDGNTNVRIARLTPDGGLDAEFGDNGIVTTAMGDGRSQAFDVLVQRDGRIVTGGVARRGGRDVFALARYRTDGGLDPTFGDGGIVLLPVGSRYASIGDIERGPGGSIFVAGQAVDAAGVPRIAIARVTATGALDPGFGSGGVVLGGRGAYGYGLALGVTRAGAPIAAGVAGDSADPATYRFAEFAATASGARLRAAEHRVGASYSFANALTLLPDGDFLSAGAATDTHGRAAMATVRANPGGGRVRARLYPLGATAVANDVLTDPTGGTWLVGQIAHDGGYAFSTARLSATGVRERATEITWSRYPIARAIAGAVQRSGRLVTVGIGCAAGTMVSCEGGTPVLLVARQQGGRFAPTVKVQRAISTAALRRGLLVRVRLARPARVDARLVADGRVLCHVRTATAHARVKLRLRAQATVGPLRLVVRAAGESTTRRVALRG